MLFTGLTILVWLCHFFAAAALVLFISLYDLAEALKLKSVDRKRIGMKMVTLIPMFLLALLFSTKASDATATVFAEMNVLNEWLAGLKAMENYGTSNEWHISIAFYVLIITAILLAFTTDAVGQRGLFYMLLTVALLFLYYFMPLNFFSGGLINLRMMYLLLIVLCLVADAVAVRLYIYARVVTVLAVAVLASWNEYINLKPFSRALAELMTVTPHIKPQSVVLPVTWSPVNFEYNFLLYPAAGTDVVVLDNAEAATPQSLVRWKPGVWNGSPVAANAHSNESLEKLNDYERMTGIRVDYFLRWRYESGIRDHDPAETNKLISRYFIPVYTSANGFAELFKRKP